MCALLHHGDTCEPSDAAHHIFIFTLCHTLSYSVTVFIMFCYDSMEHDGEMLTSYRDPTSPPVLYTNKLFFHTHLCSVWSVDSVQPLRHDSVQAIKRIEMVNLPSPRHSLNGH